LGSVGIVASTAVVLGAGAATATSSPSEVEFKVTLRGELFESRQVTKTKKITADCSETTRGGGSLRIKFRSTDPASIVIRRGANGAAVFMTRAIRGIVGTVSLGGSFLTNHCTGGATAGDCFLSPSRFRGASTNISRIARGTLGLGRLRPALASAAPCAPGFPRILPRLGLPLAEGFVSEAKLLNPTAKTVTAEGYMEARNPVTVSSGTGKLVQRVQWRLTFTRVQQQS
jgi:hypothetical protein